MGQDETFSVRLDLTQIIYLNSSSLRITKIVKLTSFIFYKAAVIFTILEKVTTLDWNHLLL